MEAPHWTQGCHLAEWIQISTYWEINERALWAMLRQAGQHAPRGINQNLKGRNGHMVKVTGSPGEKRGGASALRPLAKVDLLRFRMVCKLSMIPCCQMAGNESDEEYFCGACKNT